MKKILVSTILGLTLAVTSVQAQSAIQLYSYAGNITFNGTSPVLASAGYTVGFYYALGDVAATVNTLIGGATSAANWPGSLVGTGLTLATGVGSTAALGNIGPGSYGTVSTFVIPGATGNATVTLVLVAYPGSSYETGFGFRGHSAAFTMTALASPAFPLQTGNYAGAFSIPTPEPSTFALAGLGLASLLIFRRRK